MNSSKLFRNSQRGMTLTGLIFGLAVIGVVGVFASRMIPAYIEYHAIKGGIAHAKSAGGTDREIREAFDRHTDINDVVAVRGRDLVITREGDVRELSFSYEKRLPLMANVSILIDFAGTTARNGVVAAAAAQ